MNKKAQTGTTLTWIVATIIIIVLLTVTIFLAQFSSSNKKVSFSSEKDTLVSKSFFGYLSTNNKDIYNQIKIGDLNKQTGDLALEVFEIFEDEYPKGIWLGIILNDFPRDFKNQFFGSKPSLVRSGYLVDSSYIKADETVWLNENKSLEIIALKEETTIP